MGQMLPYLILGGAQIGSSALGSALAPDPFQHRASFEGTGADPVSWLSDVRGMTQNMFGPLIGRANEPIDVGGNVDLSPSPTFDNPALPWSMSGPSSTPPRVRLQGFGIPDFQFGSTSAGAKANAPVSPDVQAGVNHLTDMIDNHNLHVTDTGSSFMLPGRAGMVKKDVYDAYKAAQKNTYQPAPGVSTSTSPSTPAPVPDMNTVGDLSQTDPNVSSIQGKAAARLLQHALGAAA